MKLNVLQRKTHKFVIDKHWIWRKNPIPCSIEDALRARAEAAEAELAQARAELAALKAANRWIPVEERLPEESGSYLFLFRHKYIYKEFYVPEWGKPYIGFTHWRYLPEPPEVSE